MLTLLALACAIAVFAVVYGGVVTMFGRWIEAASR